MKIAIVGTGISGLCAARRLHKEHDVTVYEARDRIGGHTATVDVELEGRSYAIDTGFIVFNQKTYPRFCALLEELNVPSQPSAMSFSVRCEENGLEYNGTSINGLFAQRRNLLRPRFWRMIRDILRFNREAPRLLDDGPDNDDGPTLGNFLEEGGYSEPFVRWHLMPMAAAVWSTDLASMLSFPAKFLVRFFHNHAFLQVEGRPVWRVVRGGSRSYLDPLVEPFRDRIRTSAAVQRIERGALGVRVTEASGQTETYDHVVLACHSDQALRMLGDPTPAESEILGAIRYQPNEVTLHTDASLLPRSPRAWASWNYHLPRVDSDRVTVTYLMNELQGIEGPPWFCVTLNRDQAIDPAKILRQMTYHHPLYTPESVRAQSRWAEISSSGQTSYCGAYWRYGFHEDGVWSAERVTERLATRAIKREPLCPAT
ncbi:MAG: NAD(P)/FAD-dependent oxidoreductase [Planctomycetota bacterium]|jgi:predicted NAD/FAD-binding protein